MNPNEIITWLNGRKTYTVAVVMGLVAAALWCCGGTTFQESLLVALQAGAIAAGRHALSKLPEEQLHQLQKFAELYNRIKTALPEPSPTVIQPHPTHQVEAVAADGVSVLRVFPAPSPPSSTSVFARPADGIDPSAPPP